VDGHPLGRLDRVFRRVFVCARLPDHVHARGVTGFFLAAVPADLHEHGTYFVVGHIHYVLYGGSVFGIYAGLYYWWPKMTAHDEERLGQWHAGSRS